MASLQYFIKHRQCRISSFFFFFECVTLHENPEPEAIFVYKGHQPVIILFADMFHRCGAAATRPGDYNIQNHVRWINPDLLRHVSSFPVLKRISRCKDCKAATAAHLKAWHAPSCPQRAKLRLTLQELHKQYHTPMKYHTLFMFPNLHKCQNYTHIKPEIKINTPSEAVN